MFQRIHRRRGRRAAASSEPPGIDGRKRQRRKEGRLREGKEGEEAGEGWGMSCTGQAARPRAGGHWGGQVEEKALEKRELGAERSNQRGAILETNKQKLGYRNELVWRGQWGFFSKDVRGTLVSWLELEKKSWVAGNREKMGHLRKAISFEGYLCNQVFSLPPFLPLSRYLSWTLHRGFHHDLPSQMFPGCTSWYCSWNFAL